MKILALDTSSRAASCAVLDGDHLLGESFLNAGLTHSQTILPLVHALLSAARLTPGEIDLFAVSRGPGSFTGLRIGMGVVKGLAMGADKPCLGVSTLESLAENVSCTRGIVVPVMDARREQVYTALFSCDGVSPPARIEEDMALSVESLGDKLFTFTEDTPVLLVGDGAPLCYDRLSGRLGSRLHTAPPALLHQRAASVGYMALRRVRQGDSPQDAAELAPVYLRLPQAERELLTKKKEERP